MRTRKIALLIAGILVILALTGYFLKPKKKTELPLPESAAPQTTDPLELPQTDMPQENASEK